MPESMDEDNIEKLSWDIADELFYKLFIWAQENRKYQT